MQLEVQKKDILRLKEEFPVPANKPNIRELLWENIQLQGCRIRLEEGKLAVEESFFLFRSLQRGGGGKPVSVDGADSSHKRRTGLRRL